MSHHPPTGVKLNSPASLSTSISLLQRVRTQDAEAWQRLADLYGPLVHQWCRDAGLQAEDAADVLQEVFGTVMARVADFERGENHGSFRGWLRVIARNKIGDQLVRLKNNAHAVGGTSAQQRLQQIAAPADPSITAGRLDEGSLLSQRALEVVRAEFEDRTWQAFWRIAGEGQSPAQVAKDLGMTLHAVYKAKSRVLCRLRLELDHPLG